MESGAESTMEIQTVVIDNGSNVTKGGFAGEANPRCAFPTRVGRPKQYVLVSSFSKDLFIGDEARSYRRGVMILTYPMEYGRIRDWDSMFPIWKHTYFNELRVDPQMSPTILTESSSNPTPIRIKIAEHFFEELETPAFYLANKAVLALYAAGRLTGTVVDAGCTATQSVPVYEGYEIFNAAEESYIGGRDITALLIAGLRKKGIACDTRDEDELMNDIKHRRCYVSLYCDMAMKQMEVQESKNSDNKNYRTNYVSRKYTMPDGWEFALGPEQFTSTEVVFDPSIGDKPDAKRIQRLCFDSIHKCDLEVQTELYRNIFLVGGTAQLQGLTERFERELAALATGITIRVYAPIEGKDSVWIGGSVLGSLSSFEHVRITKSEYQEHGFSIVQRRCY